MKSFKVSSRSNPNSLAGAIVAALKEVTSVEVSGVGAGAINQAVKAVAVGRSFVKPEGHELICIPSFEDINIDGEDRTGIKITIEKRIL